MSTLARVLLAILTGLSLLCSAVAQESSPLPDARSLVVNVLDQHGIAIRDLTKENFLLRLNGKPTVLLAAKYSLAPRRVVVLLDRSGSMAGGNRTDRWALVREAVMDLLRQTPNDVPIAMLPFTNVVRDRFDFSQSRVAISKWLNEGPGEQPNLKSKENRTALFDAILEGLRVLQPVQPGDAIYAITDGGDNASHSSQPQTKTALLESGVRLFVLCPTSLGGRTIEENEGRDLLSQTARDTGGFAFDVVNEFAGDSDFEHFFNDGNRAKVKEYTEELNVQVHGFWTLQLEAPTSSKPAKLMLEIVDGAGKARKDLVLTYPRFLPALK